MLKLQTGSQAAKPGQLRSDLQSSTLDAVAHGTMVGIGETYFAAFVLAVGLGEIVAGMIATVPLVVGGAVQMVSPWMLKRWFSAKQWVVGCALLQAFSFLPFVLAALTGSISSGGVLLAAAFYWGTGLATGPTWNAWMGQLVPRKMRATYFSRRTRWAQLFVMFGFLAGGMLLQLAERGDWVAWAFAGMFTVALLCRSASTYFLNRQTPVEGCVDTGVSFRGAITSLREGGGSKLLLYLIVAQAGIQLSGPYLTTYMLTRMELSYLSYTWLLAAVFLAKVLALPLCGHLANRWGAWRLLWVGGLGIAPISLCWMLSNNLIYATVLQIYSGVAWAAFELAFALLFFESIQQRYRTQVLTLYNGLHSLAAAGGSLVGAWLLYQWDGDVAGYYWLFGLSTVARLLALAFLLRVPRWKVLVGSIGFRPITVRPGAASTDAVVLPSLPDQVDAQDLPPQLEN